MSIQSAEPTPPWHVATGVHKESRLFMAAENVVNINYDSLRVALAYTAHDVQK